MRRRTRLSSFLPTETTVLEASPTSGRTPFLLSLSTYAVLVALVAGPFGMAETWATDGGPEPAVDQAPQAETASGQMNDYPIDRDTLLECFPELSVQLNELRGKDQLLTREAVQESLKQANAMDSTIELPPASTLPLSPPEIAARLRQSAMHLGWFFKCNNCDNWHMNFGKGFVIAADGYVATCHHVLSADGMEMKEGYLVAVDSAGKPYRIERVVASDDVADCAIIKLSGAEGLEPLPLNTEPVVGQETFVLSNPLGMSDYFSDGLINRIYVNSPTSSRDRFDAETRRHLRLNVGADWAPGSSGAAIVDRCGNVLGLVCAARGLMGPANHGMKLTGSMNSATAGQFTTFFTVHEAGTAIAIQMLAKTQN